MILQGDMRELLAEWPEDYFHAVVTDPPYGLGSVDAGKMLAAWVEDAIFESTGGGFMNKAWDAVIPGPEYWRLVLRAAKPGAYIAAFSHPRTVHWLAVSLTLAGWEIRDTIMWLNAAGMPKSVNVARLVDEYCGYKADSRGARFTVAGKTEGERFDGIAGAVGRYISDGPGAAFQGRETALAPGHEPIVLARKPLEGTVAQTMLVHGTGALRVDACRLARGTGPKNVLVSEHEGLQQRARYFTKVQKAERDAGLEGPCSACEGSGYARCKVARCPECRGTGEAFPRVGAGELVGRKEGSAGIQQGRAGAGRTSGARNRHPTVKPIALMQWLVRLLAAPGQRVLDPFAGSGSTGCAAKREGCAFIGMELDPEHVRIARARVDAA